MVMNVMIDVLVSTIVMNNLMVLSYWPWRRHNVLLMVVVMMVHTSSMVMVMNRKSFKSRTRTLINFRLSLQFLKLSIVCNNGHFLKNSVHYWV